MQELYCSFSIIQVLKILMEGWWLMKIEIDQSKKGNDLPYEGSYGT